MSEERNRGWRLSQNKRKNKRKTSDSSNMKKNGK